MASTLSQQIAQYQYMVIKKQLKPQKTNSFDRLPSFSKKSRNFLDMHSLYSSWKLDQKIELIKGFEKKKVLKSNFLQVPSARQSEDRQCLFWVGNEKRSYLYSILYLLFDNLRSNSRQPLSEEKLAILKGVLYNIAEQQFENKEKEIFIEGICLLRYYSSSLNEFFSKHEDFEEICLKLITSLIGQDYYKQLKFFKDVTSKINEFFEKDVRKLFPQITDVFKMNTLLDGADDLDYIIKFDLLNERTVYIVCEKGCIFLYESKGTEEQGQFIKTTGSDKKWQAKQIAQSLRRTTKTKYSSFIEEKGEQILLDQLAKNLFEDESDFESKLGNLTRMTENSIRTFPLKVSHNFQRSCSTLEIPYQKQVNIQHLLKTQSNVLESVNMSPVSDNRESIVIDDFSYFFRCSQQKQDKSPMKQLLTPTAKKIPQFLSSRRGHNENQNTPKSRGKVQRSKTRELSPARTKMVSLSKKKGLKSKETIKFTSFLRSPRVKA